MAQVRAQVVLQGGSGLPEDQFVNVFHFVTAGSYATDAPSVAAALVTRYQAIQSYLSEYVLPAAEVKTYDLTTSEPRVPLVTPFTLTIQTSLMSLPSEVAVCLSFHGGPPVTPRRRGRVYLGPWNVSVLEAATSSSTPKPHEGFVTQLSLFGAGLLDADLGWSIWSPTTATFVTVFAGWVDNEFDTMRSRGGEATARQFFTA